MRRFGPLMVLALLLFVLPCAASDYSEEFSQYRSGIPQDVIDVLPEGFLSDSVEESADGMQTAMSFEWAFSMLKNAFVSSFPNAEKMLLSTLALLVGAALFRLLSDGVGGTTGEGISFCLNGMILLSTLGFALEAARAAEDFLRRLCTLVNSMIPMVGVLLASGGNVSAAVSETGALGIFIVFCENFCLYTLFPVLSACMAFAAASAFSDKSGADGIARGIKKTFTFLLGLMALIISAVMSGQTLLSAKTDSLGARTAKFAAGTFIPVVGGTVGEALRTVAAGVEYLRATVGIGAIIVVCTMLLPTLIPLALGRMSLSVSASCASLLGLNKEASILNDFANFYGYLMSVCSICSVLVVYALVLFVRISAAV